VHGTRSCALFTAFRVEMLGVAANEGGGKAGERRGLGKKCIEIMCHVHSAHVDDTNCARKEILIAPVVVPASRLLAER